MTTHRITSALALLLTLNVASLTAPRLDAAASAAITLVSGEKIEGKVAGVHGPYAVIAAKKSSRLTSLAELDDASLGLVADYLASRPEAAIRWADSTSIVAKSLQKKLEILTDGKLKPLALGDRTEPEFYLAYCSAHWCPPCRRFTPVLAEEYHNLKVKYGATFELVFISSDHDASEQEDYVVGARMPWPVVKYSAAGGIKPLEQWKGSGIPDLIVTNRDGQALFKSYNDGKYVGPTKTLYAFKKFLTDIDPTKPAVKTARHRLEVIRHLRAAGRNPAPAKPYHTALNLRRYQRVPDGEYSVSVSVDATGKVENVLGIFPDFPSALEEQLRSEITQFLFLPACENGVAQTATVEVPLTFRARDLAGVSR